MEGNALVSRMVVTRVRVCDASSTARRRRPCFSSSTSSERKQKASSFRAQHVTNAATKDDALRDLKSLPDQLSKWAKRVLESPPPNFPPGPEGDVAVELGADPLKFLEKTKHDFGDVVGLKLAGERCVLVSSPTVAKDVLIDRAELFVKEGTAFFPGSSLAGEGLLVSDGDTWKRQRRLSNPAFRKAAVDTYCASMARNGAELLTRQWSTRSLRDAYSDFNDLTLTIVAESLFGADIQGSRGKLINNSIKKAFEFFGKRSSTGFIVPEWVPTGDNLEYNSAVAELDEAVYALIADRRAKRVDNSGNVGGASERSKDKNTPRVKWDASKKDWVDVPTDGNTDNTSTDSCDAYQPDLLDRLLDAVDEEGDGSGMDDKSLRDELMTLMVAGQETSAILLSWVCSYLAQNPEVAAKCRVEADEVFGGDCTTTLPSFANYTDLKYCQAVVYETMRLAPPAYMVGRCCAEDINNVGGYDLPKGTTVLIAPYLLHKDPRHWSNVDRFDPERWLQLDPETKDLVSKSALKGMGPNGAYTPFGAGPRNCIGTGFAMMEGTVLLAMISQSVDLRLKPGSEPPKPKALITLRPEPFELDVVPRRNRK